MRAVVQRVTQARVTVDDRPVASINLGLCALVAVGANDDEADAVQLANKVAALRIFEDAQHKMNQSILEQQEGALLAVSQFTLYGDVRRGNRPSFTAAMEPVRAKELFEHFCDRCRAVGIRVETGRFREHMQVELTNSGPVTVLLDTEKAF